MSTPMSRSNNTSATDVERWGTNVGLMLLIDPNANTE